MNNIANLIYYICKSYNEASDVNTINKISNNQFTYYDLKKECFDASVDCLIRNPLYKEFIKAYVQ